MHGIIVRILIIMLGLFLATSIVPGVHIEGFGTFLLAAILLGIINADEHRLRTTHLRNACV